MEKQEDPDLLHLLDAFLIRDISHMVCHYLHPQVHAVGPVFATGTDRLCGGLAPASFVNWICVLNPHQKNVTCFNPRTWEQEFLFDNQDFDELLITKNGICQVRTDQNALYFHFRCCNASRGFRLPEGENKNNILFLDNDKNVRVLWRGENGQTRVICICLKISDCKVTSTDVIPFCFAHTTAARMRDQHLYVAGGSMLHVFDASDRWKFLFQFQTPADILDFWFCGSQTLVIACGSQGLWWIPMETIQTRRDESMGWVILNLHPEEDWNRVLGIEHPTSFLVPACPKEEVLVYDAKTRRLFICRV